MGSSDVLRPDAQVHFGVFFQGVNHTTIWSDPSSGSQIDFETFRQVVTTAERGLFDAFFLGEGLRLREQDGKILDLDIVGRPDAIAQLSALAGITERIGLVATQNTTYNEPGDLARRLSGLDILSGGRAGGTPSRPTTPGRERISGAAVFSIMRCATSGPVSSFARRERSGIRGPTTPSRHLPPARSGPIQPRYGISTVRRRSSRSHSTRRCRAAPRDIRSFSRPAIRRRAEISPRPMPMSSSPGTARISTMRWRSPTTSARVCRSGPAGRRHQNPSGDSDRAGGEGVRGRGEATLGPRGPVHGTDGVVPCGSGVGP